MTILEKLEYIKNKGWTYDPKTGIVLSHKGKIVKHCRINNCKNSSSKTFASSIAKYGYYYVTGTIPHYIIHLDGNKNNNKFENLKGIEYKPTIIREISQIESVKSFTRPKYLDAVDLTYEIIISQGKGKLTSKCATMLINIVENLIKRFDYVNPEDRKDCLSGGILAVLTNWKHFDYKKYNNAFPYISEIAKRGIAKCYGEISGKNFTMNYTPTFISLSNY